MSVALRSVFRCMGVGSRGSERRTVRLVRGVGRLMVFASRGVNVADRGTDGLVRENMSSFETLGQLLRGGGHTLSQSDIGGIGFCG